MGILDTVKDVGALAKEVNRLDLYAKVVDLMAQVTELAGENSSLRQQNEDLIRQLELKKKLVFHSSLYWIKEPKQPADGPYCPNCYDGDAKLMRLIKIGGYGPQCFRCKNEYMVPADPKTVPDPK